MTLPTITTRQQDILKLLYQFRFLTRIQIQAFLNHKDHKTINLWLKDLREKQYVCWIYSTDYGEINKAAIYFIGINGIRWLKSLSTSSPELLRNLYREKSRHTPFITSCLLLGDCALTLQTQSTEDTRYDFALAADFAPPEAEYDVLSSTSCQLLFIKREGDATTHYLLEILDAEAPGERPTTKLRRYLAFYREGEWERATGEPFPILMFICPNTRQLIAAKRYARRLLTKAERPKDLRIRFATTDEVKEQGVLGEIWEVA
jgi:hypothetical protein